MPIDKITPRVLNSDADNKTIDRVQMRDALNLYSGPDNEGFDSSGGKSDAGNQILKNIKGNVQVSVFGSLPGDARVVGSVEDVKTDITYIFVHSSMAINHGIWAYDRYGKLPNSDSNSLRRVYRSNQFNFPQNGFVKADIVYSNASQTFIELGPEFDKDAIIYFTDGKNEPRKINAYRAISAPGNGDIHGTNNTYSEADFITACSRTPLDPIKFRFENDSSRSTSNFLTTPGFQFAYQYVYKDGTESAISPYSEVAYPPSILTQGSSTYVNHSEYNECVLSIPMPPETVSQYQNLSLVTEVSSIKILAKQGSAGAFLVVDEIRCDDGPGEGDIAFSDLPAPGDYELGDPWVFTYRFYNDRIGIGVSTNEVNKQFNAVPRRANTQAVTSNRLMYGNYLDGFDSVKTKCTATVIYKEAPESFISYQVESNPSIEPNFPTTQGGDALNAKSKSVGLVLDFSEMPSSIPANAELSVNVTIAPDQNWHLYRFGSNSFAQTRQLGTQEQEGVDNFFNGVNTEQGLAEDNEDLGSLYLTEKEGKMFGSSGVEPTFQSWRVVDTTNPNVGPGFDVSSNVFAYGTSAANPLIIKGGAVLFKATIRSNQDILENAPEKINQAFHAAFFNPDLIEDIGFTLLDSNSSSSYSFDVGLQSGQRLRQAEIGSAEQTTSPESKLITACRTRLSNISHPPGGYFIVDKATVKVGLREVDYGHYPSVPSTLSRFRLAIEKIQDAEVFTCIHPTTDSNEIPHALDWIAISMPDMELIQEIGIQQWLSGKGLDPNLKFHLHPQGDSTVEDISLQIGRLNIPGLVLSGSGESFCLMDGEGGVGGGPCNGFEVEENGYDREALYNQGSVTVNGKPVTNQVGVVTFGYESTMFYGGRIGIFQGTTTTAEGTGVSSTALPLVYRVGIKYKWLPPGPDPDNSSLVNKLRPNLKRNQSTAEVISSLLEVSGLDDLASRSFKTDAVHDFGVVYYDQRGRHGFVNHLKSVFVDGYTKRPGLNGQGEGKGPVSIRLELEHDPPSWAHHYKIVYSNNTSVEDFIQYSAGGAFASISNDDEISESNQNIYVSLNYLQGHPISYVSSFGARTPEGGLNMYKFEEGDKLKVISHFEGTDRIYTSHEFDVVNMVKLGPTDNPLSLAPEENQKGDFIVLRNNATAYGFTHGEVLSGISKWNDNCIIELRTPNRDLDADQIVFYETEETYPVVRVEQEEGDPVLEHFQNTVEIKNGDVWFRPVATNVRDFNNGEYVDIIPDNDSNDPEAKPNFKNVFMETSTASDLFRADNTGLGRPNFVLKNEKETTREATITYSDPSNPEGRKLNYSSFNASLGNFKDLPESYGGIEYMGDRSDSVVVIQKDKISRVPVDRRIISDVSGNEGIIASTSVLNEPVFYYGQSGCDTDPSSVFDSGEEIYFCNKSLSKVFKWTSSNGAQDLSSAGLSSVIRASLRRAIENNQQVRIVGGFDPLKKEYLFTVLDIQERSTLNANLVLQPIIQLPAGPGEEDPNEDTPDESAQPEIIVDRDVMSFGSFIQSSTASASLAILNQATGTGSGYDLSIESIILSNDSMSFDFDLPLLLSPGDEFIALFSFLGNSVGEIQETITINSNDPDNPSIVIDVIGTVEEVETSELVFAYNELFGSNLTDEDMSAELAVEYLVALAEEPVEDQPTLGLMQNLFNQFPTASQSSIVNNANILDTLDDLDNDGNIDIQDLLLFLETAETATFDAESSVFSPTPEEPAPDTGGPNPGPPAPDTGGDTPTPFDPGTISTSSEFESVDDAITYLLGLGNMTISEFHALKSNLITGLSFNYNQNDRVDSADLLQFLSVFDTNHSTSENAFIPGDPAVGSGGAEFNISSEETIDFIVNDGTMTVGQFYNLASHVRKAARADQGNDGNVGSADLLFFLESFHSGPDSPNFQVSDLALQQ